jgi:CheY-like chemotaxis protein
MNGIVGATELLKDEVTTAAQKNYTDIIATSAQSLLHLINDLLDISKIESGKLELEQEVFDLAQVLMGVRQLLLERASRKSLYLDCDVSAVERLYFVGDPNRVRQIFTNLIANAIKFTERGGVSVTVENVKKGPAKGSIKIIVADTGIGIRPEHVENLFNRFEQADSSITRRFGGTGLGLSICKQLCELMGGSIEVSSRFGKGSEFVVCLPLALHDGASHSVAAGHSSLQRHYQKRALLAEDNAVNQVVISAFMKKLGIDVDVANDGVEAFEMASDKEYDLVLMDMQMPNMDGISSCKLIRGLEGRRGQVPIIAMTANAMEQDKRNCLKAGMNGFVAKPIALEPLVAELDRCLSL